MPPLARAIGVSWLLAFLATYGLLHAVDQALSVPGASAGIDAILAFFIAFPLALLFATARVIARAGAGGKGSADRSAGAAAAPWPWRTTAVACAWLLVEAALLAAITSDQGLFDPGLWWLRLAVFVAWLGALLAVGRILEPAFSGLR